MRSRSWCRRASAFLVLGAPLLGCQTTQSSAPPPSAAPGSAGSQTSATQAESLSKEIQALRTEVEKLKQRARHAPSDPSRTEATDLQQGLSRRQTRFEKALEQDIEKRGLDEAFAKQLMDNFKLRETDKDASIRCGHEFCKIESTFPNQAAFSSFVTNSLTGCNLSWHGKFMVTKMPAMVDISGKDASRSVVFLHLEEETRGSSGSGDKSTCDSSNATAQRVLPASPRAPTGAASPPRRHP